MAALYPRGYHTDHSNDAAPPKRPRDAVKLPASGATPNSSICASLRPLRRQRKPRSTAYRRSRLSEQAQRAEASAIAGRAQKNRRHLVVHPLVRTHPQPAARRSTSSDRIEGIVGMDDAEALPLLDGCSRMRRAATSSTAINGAPAMCDLGQSLPAAQGNATIRSRKCVICMADAKGDRRASSKPARHLQLARVRRMSSSRRLTSRVNWRALEQAGIDVCCECCSRALPGSFRRSRAT